MSHARPGLTTCSQYDAALHALSAARQRWAETSVNRRLALLRQIKDALAGIAPAWVAAAAATHAGAMPARASLIWRRSARRRFTEVSAQRWRAADKACRAASY